MGLGYVGLPLMLAYAKAGVRVIGFDIDPTKPDALARGESYSKHNPSAAIQEALKSGRLTATTDFSSNAETTTVIVPPMPCGTCRGQRP